MSLFTCCFWWFVLGVLLGWLLNWLLLGWLRKDPPAAERVAAPTPSPQRVVAPASPARPLETAAPPRLIDVGAARVAGFNLKHADDLTIIEGIGPKIDELFRASGVTTFAHVARLSVGEMQAILDKGGPNFKLAVPGTWARQALLASENRWSELKKLQDELIGGIGPSGNL